MIPLYVMLCPDPVVLLGTVNRIARSYFIGPVIVGIVALAGTTASEYLFDVEDLFEYPDYGLWGVSFAWNCMWWSLLLLASSRPQKVDTIKTTRVPIRALPVLGFLFLFAMAPYVGLRNYPALAMFSNLRTEGHWPNHFFPSVDLFGYQKDYAFVVSSNFGPLRDVQVNLGELFPKKLTSVATSFNLSTEFYICPPVWMSDETAFRPFSIPFIEMRRRVAKSLPIANDTFIEYIRFKPGTEPAQLRFDADSIDEHKELTTPLSVMEEYLVRFRSFDDNYSPCRH
jgi:hypothetical protein